MKTLNDIQNMNSNAANVASNNNKINDFGQKIGGARKDLYQAAHEWAAQLADITAEALTKAGGVSKLVRLPNLEKLTEAGAITADQARAALIIWRGIERKPQGSYKADRWAERTRARLEAAAAVITATEPQADNVADIIKAARESAEFAVISAAQWPAVAFSFGKYSVIRCRYSNVPKLQIQDSRYYRGTASEDPADIARQLREMVSRDEEQAADRRAAGPALGVYMNRAGVYYIAPADRSEIILQTYEDRAAALKAYREDRAALVERYAALKSFPACRRDWNRPRVGEDWRKGENMTPEQFAAVLPFRGVEFGNWVNQTERAALLNSAFDGFHDLAAVLNIAPAAVTLNGSLAFAFASRGHSGAAAHYEPARRVINLTKKSGAGCMAHEWWHAVDNFAAGGGIHNYATERRDHPRAFAILEAIKRTDYYRRSQNLAKFKGDYWTEGRELTARAFEGVCAVMLNAAGICSDFLVNCKSMDEFTAEDVARRSDYYPYPTADEAAALLPLYVAFLREVFGDVLTAPAACYEEAKRAAARAEEQRKEAERIAAERAEAERQERERKAAEMRERAAREAEERRQAAAHAVGLLRDVLTARHLDAIATAYDSATAYAVGHLEGEIYTISADIKTADTEGRAYIESRPAACIQYKRVHNAKRIICHRWQVAEIRANKWNARELCEALTMTDARDIVRTFADFEKADTWQKAAKLWADTQRLHEAQARRASEAKEKPATGTKAAEGATTKPATADGLTMEKYSEKATVIRGYNADQLAELLAMGGKEWRNLKGGKGVIFSTRRHADELAAWMEAQQGEGTTAPAAETTAPAAETTAPASAPADDQQGESVPAATLQEAGEVTDTTNEPAAVALPDWLRVGARVRTRGRFMMSTRSSRPQWVEGEEMTVKAINADFVELERRDESGALRGLESVATATAAAELTPIYSASEISQPAESEPAAIAASIDTNEPETPAAIAASEEEGAPLTEPNRDGLPDWLHVGTRFCLLDHVTGKPTAVRYTCTAIDYENKTVTIPEAADTFRGGSHVYRWDAFHWATFAPVTDETGTTGRVKWARNAEVITTEEMGRVDVFEIVDEWPAGYYVWLIGREHFPFAGWLPLAKDGHNHESFQRNIDRDHLKAIKVQSEAAALACMDYAYHHDRPTRSDFLQVLAQCPTDPAPEPSGDGGGETVTLQDGETCAASAWIAYAPEHLDDLKKGYSVYDVYDTENEAREDLQKALEMWRRRGNVIEHTGDYWFTWIDRENGRRHLHFICTAPTNWQERAAEILSTLSTDPTPDPSGDGVGICHSYDTDAPTTLQDSGEIKAQEYDVKTLPQIAEEVESGNIYYRPTRIKVGNFESFGDFASYFDLHYRPMLERIENGEDINENDRHLLNFLASDLLAAFKTEDSDESEDEEEPARLLVVFRDESQYRRARDFYCLKASEAPTAFYAEDYSDEIRALYFNEDTDTLNALERDLTEDLELYGFTGYHFEQD